MKEKLRMILAVTGIFLLLPLLLTVFLSGREVLRIKKQWNMESLLPMMMCREIPWEYEEEMKKVQAVLTRSSLYLRIEETGMDGEDWEKLWREVKAAQHQKGYQQAYRSMEAAVKDTEGEMLFYQSKVCEGVFHRISSGKKLTEVLGKNLETTEDVKAHMEEIRIYMRGHNLYDIFYGRYKKQEAQILTQYIELAPREDFADILDSIERFIYFESRKN